jgi:two-component sensor histidine kinase
LALSTAHSLLLEHNWASARVRQVLEATLGPHYDMARFHLSGPNVQLEAKTALSLSLLVHELATNAVKYGSLSIPAGSVRVIWSIDRLPGGSQFVLTWTENGGPIVVEPKRRGFGSRIIAMGLGSSSRGEVKYNETGLHAEFRAPLSVVLD